jgi:tRNA pseudouridine55 synthase
VTAEADEAARRPATTASGFVLVDKPAGWTSHDVVARLRRLVATRKIGHAGTLDPLATGLLICGVNRATRLLSLIGGQDKTYAARVRFGVTTTTEDDEGEVTGHLGAAQLTRADLVAAGRNWLGDREQVPSAVSAIKVAGRRAYALVRQGQTPELAARPVHIARLEWGEPVSRLWSPPTGDTEVAVPAVDIDLTVDCSAGTYIRALARDLGQAVGTGAHLIGLRRLRSGPFEVAEATVDEAALVDAQPIEPRPIADILTRVLPQRVVDDETARRIGWGQVVPLELAGPTVLLDATGRALAVYGPDHEGARAQVVLVDTVGAER